MLIKLIYARQISLIFKPVTVVTFPCWLPSRDAFQQRLVVQSRKEKNRSEGVGLSMAYRVQQ